MKEKIGHGNGPRKADYDSYEANNCTYIVYLRCGIYFYLISGKGSRLCLEIGRVLEFYLHVSGCFDI